MFLHFLLKHLLYKFLTSHKQLSSVQHCLYILCILVSSTKLWTLEEVESFICASYDLTSCKLHCCRLVQILKTFLFVHAGKPFVNLYTCIDKYEYDYHVMNMITMLWIWLPGIVNYISMVQNVTNHVPECKQISNTYSTLWPCVMLSFIV